MLLSKVISEVNGTDTALENPMQTETNYTKYVNFVPRANKILKKSLLALEQGTKNMNIRFVDVYKKLFGRDVTLALGQGTKT